MSARQTIDSMQFARSGGQLSGELCAEGFQDSLSRLVDIVSRDSPRVQYQLNGGMRSGRPVLRLKVRATVELVCQRCLGVYAEELALERVYPIARDEAELARWERDEPLMEALVADPRMIVSELIEDEILLSLPTVPRHPEGMCDKVLVQQGHESLS
jgi:uncharacterized protein